MQNPQHPATSEDVLIPVDCVHFAAAAAAAKLLQLCPTLCNPVDGSP